MASREDTSRYREAAEAALQQLDYCINYLRQIHKKELAARLEQNRTHIAQGLSRR